MLDEITEAVLKDLLRRVKILENNTNNINHTNKINNIGTASIKQINYIKTLGGTPPSNLSKQEAGFMIEELKKKEKVAPKERKNTAVSSGPKTDIEVFEENASALTDAIYDERDKEAFEAMKNMFGPKLTKEEADQLEKEGDLL